MPKSPRSSPSSANPKNTSDDTNSRLSDIALRKKKNADAQAAFRARRANYIATLEETVTSLESVVLQLQESWRDSRAELQDARQEILRLQHQCRERDHFWRDLWENRRAGPTPDTDDISSPSFSPLNTHHSALAPQMASQIGPYSLEGIAYRSSDDTPTPQSAYSSQQEFSATGNPLSFHEGEVTGDGSHCLSQRVEKMSYVARFSNDDHKLNLGNFEAASFSFNGDRFPESRSLSPTSTTPSSASSTTMPSASYQYAFSDPTLAQDSFRRSSHSNEMTLHGGTADISVVPGADTVRYRLGSRQPISMPDRPVLPLARPGSASETQQERGSSDVVPAISCTVAVIKAQAFGALRRTRTRTKKSTETAARVAHDVLEARGIGLGSRRRGSDDDLDIADHC